MAKVESENKAKRLELIDVSSLMIAVLVAQETACNQNLDSSSLARIDRVHPSLMAQTEDTLELASFTATAPRVHLPLSL